MTKFGLQLPNFTLGVSDGELFEAFVGIAVAGEESGFDSLWVMDHFYQLPALGGSEQPMLEAYTVLGALAARTSRARLGTLVTGVTYRNPAMLAKIITTLDVISRGRAILGIGAAWHDEEHDGLGFAFPPVKERMDRLEEAVQICRAMFRDEAPSFDGRHFRIEKARNIPRPIQPGGPPIMIGGGGERRTLKLVAQYADMCNISGDLDTTRHKFDVLRKHCDAVGRDPSDITRTRMSSLFLADSAQQAGETREMITGMAGAEFVAGCTIGTDDEVADQVAASLEAGVDYPIFNLPFADAATVKRVGELLTTRFA
ncbi:MAG: LLM class F420-dependent oxidoreductase [Acidimicrobiia bacterium]